MMSPGTIRDLAEKQARYARRNGYAPVTITQEMKDELLRTLDSGGEPSFKIPWTGGYAPRGYKPVGEEWFVDTSGWGGPAMSQREFAEKIRPGFAYAIVEAGQFQGYIQEYVPPKSRLQ